MKEYKVYQREDETEVSALYIDKITWDKITDKELQEVVHKWFNTIGFKCYIEVINKDCQIHYNCNTNNEKICIIDNCVEVLFIAYNITYSYDVCEYRQKRKR